MNRGRPAATATAAVVALGVSSVAAALAHDQPAPTPNPRADADYLARIVPLAVSRSRPLPTTTTVAPATTTTAAATTTTVRTYYVGWQNLIIQLFGTSSSTAFRVVHCESGGNPSAYNRSSGATGLFQILHGPWDPDANVREAYSMWRQRGWEPWTASEGCWAA